jgi:hypothetical protein
MKNESFEQLTLEGAIEQLQQLKARMETEQTSTSTKTKAKRGKGARVTVQTITIPGKCTQVYHG